MLQGNAPTSFNPQRLGVASVAGRRAVNEDAWATPPAGMDVAAGEFYVVADGVGGQQRGDVAAQTAVAVAFRAFYERRAAGDGPPAALLAAVETANREVYQLAHSLGVDQMGCTLAAALLVGGQLHVAHVGDARAWLLQAGRLYPLTRDHTWVQEQVDRGTIKPEDAARHELRHIVTRVLGNGATVDVTLGAPALVPPGSRLLLSSDGLHDVVSEERLARLAAQGAPADAARALVEAALAAGSEDNVTAMVVAATPEAIPGRPISGEGRLPLRPISVEGKTPPRPVSGEGRIPPRPISGEGRVPPGGPPRRRSALWAVLLAAFCVGLLTFLGVALSRGGGGAPAPTGEATRPVNPDTTTATHPAGTSTAAPSAESGYPSLVQTAPAAYPPPAEAIGDVMCITSGTHVYLWTEAQAGEDGTDLCQVAHYVIGGRVYVLDGPREMAAWDKCNPLPFLLVQSEARPELRGWVWANHVAACSND